MLSSVGGADGGAGEAFGPALRFGLACKFGARACAAPRFRVLLPEVGDFHNVNGKGSRADPVAPLQYRLGTRGVGIRCTLGWRCSGGGPRGGRGPPRGCGSLSASEMKMAGPFSNNRS